MMRPTQRAAGLIVGDTTPRSMMPPFQTDELLLPGLAKFEFAPGAHGLQWEGTRIVRVAQQARWLGVKVGWSINMVDGLAVHESHEVWSTLQGAKRKQKSYPIWFVKDEGTIRTEAAGALAEKERQAKLPVKSPSHPRHLAHLREEFPFQQYITKPEDRAITLRQLQRVFQFVESQCHRWHDAAPANVSRTSGQILHTDFLNLYHLNDWILKPATKLKDCAFVEMLATREQPPAWFISHWWGERIVDFLKCVELHVTTRSLTDRTGYWTCAYANRQHSLTDDISDDFTKMSFYNAMQVVQFKVLLILDAKSTHTGPATLFQRIWCQFEEMMCLDSAHAPLDIATCHDSSTELITKGLTEEEEAMERRGPGTGNRAKTEREKGFPFELIALSLATNLQKAQASFSRDRNSILNVITKRDVHLPPLDDHPRYVEVNRRLSALHAMAFWRRAMSETADPHVKEIHAKMSDALHADEWRTSLDMNFAGCDLGDGNGDEQMKLLGKGLPPNLHELKLDFKDMAVGNQSVAYLAAALPGELESIVIDLTNCKRISNAGVSAVRGKLPPKLKALRIGLEGTKVSQEVQEKCGTLEGLKEVALPDLVALQGEAARRRQEAEAAQKDLDAALAESTPAKEAAKEAANLDRSSLLELVTMAKPPPGGEEVGAAVSFLLTNVRKKSPWKTSQKMIGNANFIDSVANFDAHGIPPHTVTNLDAIIAAADFDPNVIGKKSPGAAGLCTWVINTVKYHKCYLKVAPLMTAAEAAVEAMKSAEEEVVMI